MFSSKRHYYNVCISCPDGTVSTVLAVKQKRVSPITLLALREAQDMPENAPILSISYMGQMTDKQARENQLV